MTASAQTGALNPEFAGDETSLHIRLAHAGDQDSASWLVAHFSPLLRMQAEYRLPAGLKSHCSAEDLVDEVWLVALPRLADLEARGDRVTSVFLKFLGTTLLNKVNNLVTRFLVNRPRHLALGEAPSSNKECLLEGLQDSITSVVQAASRGETCQLLHAAIQKLDEQEREIVILRGIEQLANQQVAALLGLTPSGATMRYQRALRVLREFLPDSIAAEFPAG